MSGFIDLGQEMRREDFNGLRVALIALSWKMSCSQLLLLADDVFDEAQSRLRPLEEKAGSTLNVRA